MPMCFLAKCVTVKGCTQYFVPKDADHILLQNQHCFTIMNNNVSPMQFYLLFYSIIAQANKTLATLNLNLSQSEEAFKVDLRYALK